MEQPQGRKGVAAVAQENAEPKEEGPPTSPKTVLKLDQASLNGGRKYIGNFAYKVPTMGDRIDIAVLKAQYLQSVEGVDSGPANIADALAYLNVTIDPESAPDWWKDSKGGIELYDFTPLLTLHAMARAYEATFLGGVAVAEDDDGESEDDTGADGEGDVGGDVQDPPVGRKVLASFGPGSSGGSAAGESGGEPEG